MDVEAGPQPTTRLRYPRLKPGLRRLHRGPGVVQIGADPERAVLLTDLDPSTRDLLTELDGRLPKPFDADLLARLHRHGLLEDAGASCPGWRVLPGPDRDRLTPDLASMSLLDQGSGGGKRAMSRRLAAHVEIRGGGRVGASLAGLLAAAGVGEVRVVDDAPTAPADLSPAGLRAADLGRPRGEAAGPPPLPAAVRAAARRRLPTRRRVRALPSAREHLAPVDLVVLATDDGVLPSGADLWRAGVPHLVAQVRETAGTVGPLVVPGRTSCLRCHDLIRAERDADWMAVAAQLARPPAAVACDVVLATAVACHAAWEALAFLESGTATTADGSLHLSLPDGTVRRRSWHLHPACGCSWTRTGPA